MKLLNKLFFLFFKRKKNEVDKYVKKVVFFANVEFVNSTIGIYSYIARNTIVHNTKIGNFCSIGPNVVIGYGDHPLHLLSTSSVFYDSETDFDLKPKKTTFYGNQKVEIGSDVWIGANVFIKNGIQIGDGAVIGAGAVVLKDVEPFSIIVGVPAKCKSFRFEKDKINRLIELEWWNWSLNVIEENFDSLIAEDSVNNLDILFDIKRKN